MIWACFPAQVMGRPRKWSDRDCLDAILYLLYSGCRWSELGPEFPPRSTVHDRFSRTMPITAQQKSDLALKGLESLVEVDSRWFSLGHRTAGFFNLSRISRRSTFKRVVNNLLRHV